MFRSLTIRAKLIGAFSVVLILSIAQGLFTIRELHGIDEDLEQLHSHYVPSLTASGALDAAAAGARANLLLHLLTPDDEGKRQTEAALKAEQKEFDEARTVLEKLMHSPQEKALFAEFSKDWDIYQREANAALELSRKHEEQKAREHYLAKVRPAALAAEAELKKLMTTNMKGSDKAFAEANALSDITIKMTMAGLLLATLLGAALAFLIIRGISKGIASVTGPMGALAEGDLSIQIPYRGQKTELGSIAEAVQVFKDALIAKKEADEAAAVEADAKMRRAHMLDDLTKRFESNVSALTQGLASAATEMEATAQTMTETAQQTTNQSVSVASAAEQTSANVQTVAVATEELSSSIREIAEQVAKSSSIAGRAAAEAKQTDATVQALAAGAQKIGEVVALINNIAGQTNLLALNATIEAARAGEAGRGFAVVASEVKELASQTAKATEEIASQINAIQEETRNAVGAIQTIGSTIDEMNAIAAGVAAAMEEQGAATGEIARNVQQAAQGTQVVTGSILDVKRGAGETGSAAAQVLTAAQELARHSEDLGREVDTFLSGVKAA
jgi:methyl-accepting chemotaxis protein